MTDVAVVTGAGRGMGRAVATRLVRRGYLVVATDVDDDAVRRTATDLGDRCIASQHDVRDPDHHRAVAATAAEHGDVRIWVNNAGILDTGPLWEQADATIQRIVEVNLLGVIHGTRAALDVMRRHGRPADIINMASMSAYGPLPGLATYAATKAAVLSWTMTAAAELSAAQDPIRMHAVSPDGVKTDMVSENAHNSGSAMIFSGPLLDPEHVADEVVALIGSRRLIRSIPRHRAFGARLSGLAPTATLPLVAMTQRIGERNRRKSLS